MKRIITLLTVCIIPFLGSHLSLGTTPTTVTVSIPPLVEFVKALGAEAVSVTSLVHEKGSAEFYQPTFLKVKKLKKSKLIVLVGTLPFENNLLYTLRNHPNVVVLSTSKPGQDEHTWVSLTNAQEQFTQLYRVFLQLNIIDETVLKKRYFDYMSKLSKQNNANKQTYASLSQAQVASYHPFLTQYFLDYSQPYHALEEHGRPFTPRHLQTAINTLKQENTKLMITANKGHAKKMKPVSKALNLPIITLNPLSERYLDFHKQLAEAVSTHLTPSEGEVQ